MAQLVASWSRDPSTQCGAVIVRPDKTVAAVGFNGFPRGADDSPALYPDRAPALDAGAYFFRCDVHPTTMTGTFVAS